MYTIALFCTDYKDKINKKAIYKQLRMGDDGLMDDDGNIKKSISII